MSVNKVNIQQIQQYLNGELDAKAMHRLEKQAQDDPFLMEALEGYEGIGRDQQANLQALGQRFNKRVKADDKPNFILWRVLPVAATLLIALAAGLLWLSPKQIESQHTAKSVTISHNKDKIAPLPAPAISPQPAEQMAAVSKPIATRNKTTTAVIASNIKHTNAEHLNTKAKADAQTNPGIADILANQSPNLNIHKSEPTPLANKTITGLITDPTGHKLAGVKIAVKGTALTAVTDTNGVFSITSPAAQSTLSIAYTGFDTRQVPLNGKDSVKVVLNESTNVLAAVSVPGYVDDTPGHQSHPTMGWKAFRDYIKKNAFMPNGETGRVKLAFTVDAAGHINGMRVIRGKSDAMNQKAIALVLNGPGWTGVNSTRELKLKIRFRKVKTT